VLNNGQGSSYRDWFQNLRFGGRSPYGDPFTYEGWNGHYELIRLNLSNAAVRDHLFGAVETWIRDFGIDGLRLDAADCISLDFLKALAAFCRSRRPGFWLMGEVVHGDYRRWANPETLDSVTNYECYKGLYSSHADRNYFEIAYSLNRQFGEGGLYAGLPLYAFADNHDVNRVASNLTQPAHLYPLYCLLFTMPGVPSIYYGSEWGLKGCRANGDDRPLRPHLKLAEAPQSGSTADLARTIARLAQVRLATTALRHGNYQQLYVNHQQLAFTRQTAEQKAFVLVNASDKPAAFDFPTGSAGRLEDLLNPGDIFPIHDGKAHVEKVWPNWARILLLHDR
jgi:glycosidase